MVVVAANCMGKILDIGQWPLVDALVKSPASWLSRFAAVELPLAWAVCAASCRFVAIC